MRQLHSYPSIAILVILFVSYSSEVGGNEAGLPMVAGTSAMQAPEQKPKNIANKAMPTVSRTAVRHTTVMPVATVNSVKRLKSPNLGASALGIIRPATLAAFKMES